MSLMSVVGVWVCGWDLATWLGVVGVVVVVVVALTVTVTVCV